MKQNEEITDKECGRIIYDMAELKKANWPIDLIDPCINTEDNFLQWLKHPLGMEWMLKVQLNIVNPVLEKEYWPIDKIVLGIKTDARLWQYKKQSSGITLTFEGQWKDVRFESKNAPFSIEYTCS